MESAAAMAISPAAGMRVLAVEEDPVCLTTLTEMLQRHGYQVTAKASPEEGLRALRGKREGFDLVMTVAYTKGPGIDGFKLLRHAAKKRYPVILFSGFDPADTMMRGMLGGACAFLTKPLRDEEVRDVWQHVVRRKLSATSGGAAAIADAPSRKIVVVRQDDETATKRISARLDDSSEGGSDGRTTKRSKFSSSSSELHASLVKAAEQLRGTEGCPYSCVKRAPHAFAHADDIGTARAISQGHDDNYPVQLAVGQCLRNCICYVTPCQRAILEDVLSSVLMTPHDLSKAEVLYSLTSKALFENNRFRKPKRETKSSYDCVDWM